MNTTEFLAAFRRAITAPNYQNRYDNADILAFAHDNLTSKVIQILMEVNEEYNVLDVDIPHAALEEYITLPSYMIGQTVRAVFYKGAGNQRFYPLNRYELRERFTYLSPNGPVNGFSFQNDRLYLMATPQQAGIVKVFYRRKHPMLIPVDQTARVSSQSGTTVALTDTPPASFVAGAFIDFTKTTANYQPKVTRVEIVSVLGSTLTVDTDLDGYDIVEGDEVSIYDTTSIVQLPEEMNQVLVWSVCVSVCKGLNIADQIKFSEDEYKERVTAAKVILQPRSKDSLPTLVQYNGVLSRPNRRWPSVTV